MLPPELIAELRRHAGQADVTVVAIEEHDWGFTARLTPRGQSDGHRALDVDVAGEVVFLRIDDYEHVDFAYSRADQAEVLERVTTVAAVYFAHAARTRTRRLLTVRRSLSVQVGAEEVTFKAARRWSGRVRHP